MKRYFLAFLVLSMCLVQGQTGLRSPAFVGNLGSGAASSSTLNADAYWKLDEASGSRADSSGNGITLTDNNTVASASGKISNAADFEVDNAGEFLSAADNATLSLGSDTDFTIWAWVFAETQPSFNAGIMCKDAVGDSSNDEYVLYWDIATDRFIFTLGNQTTSAAVSANNLGNVDTATWYLVIAWHDSGANTINIQVNNGTVNSAGWSGGTFNGTAAFHIGARVFNTGFAFDGLIDEAGFKKRVFTSDERTELYNSGTGKTCCPF